MIIFGTCLLLERIAVLVLSSVHILSTTCNIALKLLLETGCIPILLIVKELHVDAQFGSSLLWVQIETLLLSFHDRLPGSHLKWSTINELSKEWKTMCMLVLELLRCIDHVSSMTHPPVLTSVKSIVTSLIITKELRVSRVLHFILYPSSWGAGVTVEHLLAHTAWSQVHGTNYLKWKMCIYKAISWRGTICLILCFMALNTAL